MRSIEVFATNVCKKKEARVIEGLFQLQFPQLNVNFDMEDVDNILRVESKVGKIDHSIITQYIKRLGYGITVLEE